MANGNGSDTLRESGQAADEGFSDSNPDDGAQSCPSPSDWVEIQLIGEDDKGIPGAAFRIELPDGRVIEGNLDKDGIAAVKDIDSGNCVVSFPDLDKDAWEPAGGTSPA